MGHKGVSKRKPKKSRLVPGTEKGSSANDRSLVQSLVKDKSNPLSRDDMKKTSNGWNKTQKKR
jgi:hypothetical protein